MSNQAAQQIDPAPEPQEFYTSMPVGDILRKAREHYGQSLEQVAANLRIRAEQLDALETGDVDRLPGRVYAIGFVRSYSEYLGLDGNQMVKIFKSQSLAGGAKPQLNFPVPASESRLPPAWLVIGGLIFAIGFYVLWGYMSGDEGAKPAIESVPEELQKFEGKTETEINAMVAEEMAQLEETIKNPDAPLAADMKPEGITLNVIENSWVEIVDAEGNVLVSKVLQAGDQYFVPDRPDLMMSLGNAGGVELLIGDKKLEPLGKTGQIRRNISLDIKTLLPETQDTKPLNTDEAGTDETQQAQ